MGFTLLTLVVISNIVYANGEEFKCTFVSNSNCIVNHTLDTSEQFSPTEYDCRPIIPSCVTDTNKPSCSSYQLTFSSPTLLTTTELQITYRNEVQNEMISVDIGLKQLYEITLDFISNGYTIEFQCQNNQEANHEYHVSINNIEVKCQIECESNSRAGLYALIPITMIIIVGVIGLLIKRHKRIEEKKKQFERENPQYQSLKRNRVSRHYQFPLWNKRSKRKTSSASDRVYEVCGKVVGNQGQQNEGSYDYDYAYARSDAARKGFEDSAGYLKPKVEELDEDNYLKPSPSTNKRNIKLDANNLDKKVYLKPSPSSRNSAINPRDSKSVESDDDDSDYEYVVPNDVINETETNKKNSKNYDNKNRQSATPKGKPMIPKKPKLQNMSSNSSSCAESCPIKKRPQPSPRSQKRESATANKDYLSIVDYPETVLKQQSLRK